MISVTLKETIRCTSKSCAKGIAVISVCLTLIPAIPADDAPASSAELIISGQPISYWVEQLQSENPSARYGAAVNSLPPFRQQAQGAVPLIVPLLDDERPEVRLSAAQALAGIREYAAAAVPALRERLHDPDERTRLQVTFALWSITEEPEPAVTVFAQHLSSPDAEFPLYALGHLNRMGPAAERAVPAILEVLRNGDAEAQKFVLECLEEIGPGAAPAIPEVVPFMNHEDPYVANDAVDVLKSIGPAAVPALIEALGSSSQQVRVRSCEALGSIAVEGWPQAMPLARLLSDEELEVRRAAALALTRLPRGHAHPEVLTALHETTRDDDWLLRDTAVFALRLQGPAALPIFEELLSTDDADFHINVVESLEYLEQDAAPLVPRLLELLEEEHPRQQSAIIRCLGRIGPAAEAAVPVLHDLVADPSRAWFVRRDAGLVLPQLGPAAEIAIPTLIEIAQTRDESRRSYIPEEVLRDAPPEARGLMMLGARTDERGAYLDLNDAEHEWAIPALGGFGPLAHEAWPALAEIADNSAESLPNRMSAISAVGRVASNDPEALATLLTWVNTDESDLVTLRLRQSAIEALGQFTESADQVVPRLRELLHDENRDIREATAHALGDLGPAAVPAVPDLFHLFEVSDQESDTPSCMALGQIGGAGELALISALDSTDYRVRMRAVGMLRRYGTTQAIPALESLQKGMDRSLRDRAADAISQIQLRVADDQSETDSPN